MKAEEVSTEKIWELLSDRLRNFLRQKVSDDQLAEDLLQETFLRVHKHLESMSDSKRITSWVFQIARNLVVDHYRDKGQNSLEIINQLEEEQQPENLDEFVMEWLPAMVSQLPNTYRDAVELYEFHGYSQQRIAEQLGISLSGTKSRIQRGRAKLKSILLECCSFDRDNRGNIIACNRNGNKGRCEDC